MAVSHTCQGCHAEPKKYGVAVTTLDVAEWWMGKRFSELLKKSGDAARVRAAAEKRLAANPAENPARLRLACALRAQGDRAGAERELRKLPWAAFPDREVRTPPRLAIFP